MGFVGSLKESIEYAKVPLKESVKPEQPEHKRVFVKSDYNGICSVCGNPGEGEIKRNAPFFIELIAWLAALNWFVLVLPPVLAVLFSIWRRSSNDYLCNICDGKVIPMSSPIGSELFDKYHA
ncbi:MAG: hypothetical protein WCK54_18380 [Desulfuromonadales bacterium]